MLVFRIERQKYLSEILQGRGAAISSGNRWNSRNTSMIYTSGSRSLAILEVLSHVDLFNDLPPDRLLVELDIADDLKIQQLNIEQLPKNWNTFPALNSTRILGDEFIRLAEFNVLQVPSSLVEGEFNYLINPKLIDHSKIKIIKAETLKLERWRR